MAWLNSRHGYGALTKFCHWAIVGLFAFQYAAAATMLRIGPVDTVLGLTEGDFFNWHKSIGLVALIVAIVRLWSRKSGELPPWAPTLSSGNITAAIPPPFI